MDNQQATETDIAYLAGLWDGEGSYVISSNGNSPKSKLQAKAMLTNTDEAIISRAAAILDKLCITFCLCNSKPNGYNAKPCHIISVGRLEMIRALIEKTLPFTTKRGRMDLMLRFIHSRLSKPRGSSYTEDEMLCASQLHAVNRRGASETARQTATMRKIQSVLARDSKSVAETTTPRSGESASW